MTEQTMNAEITEAVIALDRLLRMTVPVPPGCVGTEGDPMSPEFRVSIQLVTDEGVHFIIHANGYSSDTLDLVATRQGLALLAPFKTGETQAERIARTAALSANTVAPDAKLDAEWPREKCGNHLDRFPCAECLAKVPVECPRYPHDYATPEPRIPAKPARQSSGILTTSQG